MIVYKKEKEIAVVFEKKDFDSPSEKMKKRLLKVIELCESINITLDMQNIEDLSVDKFSLLASFFHSLNNKDNEITILANSEILNGLKLMGLGNLLKSMEEN